MPGEPIDLTNQFLIAMPGMGDDTFSGAVVYLCEHTENGALGLVINKPIDIKLKNLFEKVELPLDRTAFAEQPADGSGPKRVLITLGFSGWQAGQLEDELGRNGWLTVDAVPEIIFDTPVAERYDRAVSLLGFDPRMLSQEAGHA